MSVKHSFLSRGYVDSALSLYFWQHIAQKLPHMCKEWRLFPPERDVYEHMAIICWVIENTHGRKSTSKHFGFTVRPPPCAPLFLCRTYADSEEAEDRRDQGSFDRGGLGIVGLQHHSLSHL